MNILKKNLLWSISLYKENINFFFDAGLNRSIRTFNNKKIRTKKEHVHTSADPFLFVEEDGLFLFYESQSTGELGQINLKKTYDLENFLDLGCVLKESFHLSYPFVFKNESSIYMIPESMNANEIILYKFVNFPMQLKKTRTLLTGHYYDSSVINYENTWYLFTTSDKGLEIYYTKDLENEELIPHPKNPISTDMKFQRCGGGPILLDNSLFRIAQDCSIEYGSNINILKITELTQTNYKEELVKENYLACNQKWNNRGGHHLSIVNFKGNKIIATDGKHEDYLINKFFSPIFKLL